MLTLVIDFIFIGLQILLLFPLFVVIISKLIKKIIRILYECLLCYSFKKKSQIYMKI